jgi:hypothetical protein
MQDLTLHWVSITGDVPYGLDGKHSYPILNPEGE